MPSFPLGLPGSVQSSASPPQIKNDADRKPPADSLIVKCPTTTAVYPGHRQKPRTPTAHETRCGGKTANLRNRYLLAGGETKESSAAYIIHKQHVVEIMHQLKARSGVSRHRRSENSNNMLSVAVQQKIDRAAKKAKDGTHHQWDEKNTHTHTIHATACRTLCGCSKRG